MVRDRLVVEGRHASEESFLFYTSKMSNREVKNPG